MCLIKNRLLLFVHTDKLVQIHMQVLKNDDDVLPKVKTVFELYDAIVAFVVCAFVIVHAV